MNKFKAHTGIWIDKNKAVVVTMDRDRSIIIPLFPSRESQPKARNGNGFGNVFLREFFYRISEVIPKSDSIVLIGPDQTKFSLKEYLAETRNDLTILQTRVAGHLGTSDIISTIRSCFYPAREVGKV